MTSPQWTPTARELADLDLVLSGALPSHRAYSVVVDDATASALESDRRLELLDPEGVPLAAMTVERAEPVDGSEVVSGPLETLAAGEFGPFRRFHRTPADVRAAHPDGLAVPVSAPLTISDVEQIRDAAATTGRTPVLLACDGPGGQHGVSGPGVVRTTLTASLDLPDAVVVAVSVAGRADPAEDAQFRHDVARAYADEVLVVEHAGPCGPAVDAVRRTDHPDRDRRGLVVFFTGLSGSGKSTLARALHDVLLERGDRTVTSLDGDVVRHHLSKGLGFSREDRETNIARIGWVAAEISRHHGVAICSPIAPFDETRQRVRAMVAEAGGGFALIHVATPLEECERRDRKGLYARARAGQIPEFTGISSPYDEPDDALVRVDTTDRSIEDALADVLDALADEGWLTTAHG